MGKEREYFEELVRYSKAKVETERCAAFDRLMVLKGVVTTPLEADRIAYWEDWRHHAIRSLLGIMPFSGDCAELGSCLAPAATLQEAQASVELLERLGLASQGRDGCWVLSDRFVSAGSEMPTDRLKQFMRIVSELGVDAIDRFPQARRSLSTVTVALARDKFEMLRERVREFRQEILRMAQAEDSADAVYQLTIQLFPIAYAPEEKA
jgi:uncharacterized protein (TIGR02147 family)